MLGSNPTRDSRLRWHHAQGEGGCEYRLPLFNLMLPSYALKNPIKQMEQSDSLSVILKKVERFNLIRKFSSFYFGNLHHSLG